MKKSTGPDVLRVGGGGRGSGVVWRPAIIGALMGYLFLHPLVMIIGHWMQEHNLGHGHSIFDFIAQEFIHAFSLSMLSWSLAFTLFGASIGLFYGKMKFYRNLQVEQAEENSHQLEIQVDERTRELLDSEKSLQSQKEFLMRTIESLSYPFYVVDARDYSIQLANSAASPDGIWKEMTCYGLTHKSENPCETDDHVCPLSQVKKTKRPVTVEHIHFDSKGNRRNYEVHGYPILDKDGTVVQMIEYSLDITERKRLERELVDILNAAPDMIHVISPDMKIIKRNSVSKKIFPAIDGEYCYKALKNEEGPCDHCGVIKVFRDGRNHEHQSTIIQQDGREISVHSSSAPIFDEFGNIAAAVEIIHDITELKMANEKINFLASIVKSVPDAICSIDVQGNIVSWNQGAEKMLGYSDDEIIGRPLTQVIPMEKAQEEIDHCINILNTEGFFSGYESVRISKDGEIIPVEITGVALQDRGRNVINYAAIMRDISERKRAYEELKSIERLKSNVIANVSHELKTPITIMEASLELAAESEDQSEREGLIETCLRALKRQEGIIDDLLAIGEMRNIKPHKEPENLGNLIEEIIHQKIKFAEGRGIKIEAWISPGLESIDIDIKKIRHVLGNLIENAIKFNEDNGKITIKAEKKDDSVEISVSDTGIGIREEDMGKIFQPLTQLDPSTKRKYGGTGTGLSVGKTIVEAHGGKIWVASKFGQGSTFHFILPIH